MGLLRTTRHFSHLCGNLPYVFLRDEYNTGRRIYAMTAMTAVSTARLEARISSDLHKIIKHAAEIQGRTITDFVVSAVQDAARRAIEQHEIIHLTLAEQQRFAEALLSPLPEPTPAMQRAKARHNKMRIE
jgi:uncharacterized protein (DUF1778 family)